MMDGYDYWDPNETKEPRRVIVVRCPDLVWGLVIMILSHVALFGCMAVAP